MPEGRDQRAVLKRRLRAVFKGNRDAQRWADETDEPVSRPDDDAQDDALTKREAAGAGRERWGGRFGSADLGHEDYCNGTRSRQGRALR